MRGSMEEAQLKHDLSMVMATLPVENLLWIQLKTHRDKLNEYAEAIHHGHCSVA